MTVVKEVLKIRNIQAVRVYARVRGTEEIKMLFNGIICYILVSFHPPQL